jgi:hypothetical protein
MFHSKELKSYKGYKIFKSWENELTWDYRTVQGDIEYLAFDNEWNKIATAKTLLELKKLL